MILLTKAQKYVANIILKAQKSLKLTSEVVETDVNWFIIEIFQADDIAIC